MEKTVYLVPRWSGKIHSDWYDWFETELTKRGDFSVEVLEMPNWTQPDIEESIKFLSDHIPHLDKSTYFVGHSVGCQAVIRFLVNRMELDRTAEIGGVLLVAAWFTVANPWETVIPWIANEGLNYPIIIDRIKSKKVVLSDNDPFTPDFKKNQQLWAERIGASSVVYPKRAHFNDKIEPAVLEEFMKMIKA